MHTTQTIKLKAATRMMVKVRVDYSRRILEIQFADGQRGEIPFADIRGNTPRARLDFHDVQLPDPYVILVGASEGGPAEIPWDFARHYCEPEFESRERQRARAHRQTLGERIRRLREAMGLSQDELAKRAGIGRVTLSRIENGEQSPRLSTLEALAQALGISIEQLIIQDGEV